MDRNHKLSKQVEKLQKQLLDTKRHVNGMKVEHVAYDTLKVSLTNKVQMLLA